MLSSYPISPNGGHHWCYALCPPKV